MSIPRPTRRRCRRVFSLVLLPFARKEKSPVVLTRPNERRCV